MDTVSIMASIAGVVELIKRAFDKDFRAVAIITGAGLAGAVLAPQVGGTWIAGLILGFGASGLVTVAGYIGGK